MEKVFKGLWEAMVHFVFSLWPQHVAFSVVGHLRVAFSTVTLVMGAVRARCRNAPKMSPLDSKGSECHS